MSNVRTLTSVSQTYVTVFTQCCEQDKIQTIVRMDQSVHSMLLTMSLGVIPLIAVIAMGVTQK
eukprot:2055311-Amphidinium_carterae.1